MLNIYDVLEKNCRTFNTEIMPLVSYTYKCISGPCQNCENYLLCSEIFIITNSLDAIIDTLHKKAQQERNKSVEE